ncbi:MAG TPA: DUF1566 domain-containing protein [Leptospiraceae bacterium]|nr:DUF1566 domain-containing protein [Leptospiraceae bacterium]HMW03551.1 DUF1566 domain-containing protein [Leptospiraceae bacterium]HMX34026.1 DUF1566 domain-containing protein [Leptospiraceae bacterium]HMY29528.1 DUF1566 domain-containing protein [Leptospiraceae bacterium]HMZ64832.1 DUF1566 domain-containing protein [Leptospiraceae bacterium]
MQRGKKDNGPLLLGAAALANQIRNNSGAGSSGANANTTVVTPTITSPAAGQYSTSQTITITTTTSDATIYYTVDGTDPTTSSNVYTQAISIWSLAGQSRTIKAIGVKSGFSNNSIATQTVGVFNYIPHKTGQTLCWDAVGNPTTCTGTKHDGDLQNGITRSYTGPTQNSTYTSDYTSTDNVTGLVWKTCSQGLSGATCASGTIAPMNWQDAQTGSNGCSSLNALNSGNGYAGKKDWRLPTRQEVETLTDRGRNNPAIDPTPFPATSGSYWTSTAYGLNTANAWTVQYNAGSMNNVVKTDNTVNVRCVSGLSRGYIGSFTDNGNGTIKDNVTGLIWQKCSMGQNNDATCSGTATSRSWANALADCNGLSLASRTWRLPNVNEINSIVDTTKTSNPTIDATFFPSTSSIYWSSSTVAIALSSAWILPFGSGGNVTDQNKNNTYNVRCVSGP